jgi:hypothetical protein
MKSETNTADEVNKSNWWKRFKKTAHDL